MFMQKQLADAVIYYFDSKLASFFIFINERYCFEEKKYNAALLLEYEINYIIFKN